MGKYWVSVDILVDATDEDEAQSRVAAAVSPQFGDWEVKDIEEAED